MPQLSLRADAGVGAIAVSPNSRDVVLAGRSGLYIVDLHDPFTLPRWLPLRSAWEVASVQWCPHPNRPGCLVSSSNQKVLIWNLSFPSEKAIEHVLHGHRRAVTDISFSSLNRDLFATSSIDTTIRLWDMRQIGSSTMTFADFSAGMMQCQWDPTNEHQLATSQASRITIWDKRMANKYVTSINAHNGECNGLEYFANGNIISCSTDRTVKVWDLKACNTEPRVEVRSDFPVWRALPTPYEYGAFVVPLRGGRNRVSLINLAKQEGEVSFQDVQLGYYEHPSKVKSAVYMRTDENPANYDLMTWSHDSHLREWRGDILQRLPHASMGSGCKDDPLEPLPSETETYNTDEFDRKFHSLHGAGREVFDLPILNRKNQDKAHTLSQLDWIAGVHVSRRSRSPAPHMDSSTNEDGDIKGADSSHEESQHPNELNNSNHPPDTLIEPGSRSSQVFSQEIISVAARFPRVLFNDINIGARTCILSLFGPWGTDSTIINIHLDIRAPIHYPNQPLECDIHENTPNLDEGVYQELSEHLFTSASKLSQHNMQSLEFCVRYLVGDPVSIDDQLSAGDTDVAPMTDIPDKYSSASLSRNTQINEIDSEAGGYLDPEHVETTVGNNQTHTLLSGQEGTEEYSTEDDGGRVSDRHGSILPNLTSSDSETDSESEEDGLDMNEEKENIIDSTPLPKSCGGVWSVTGQLICFFNHKPIKRERGPLPLDKVFADDSKSDASDAPFLSDGDEFDLSGSNSLLQTNNWSVTAAQLNASAMIPQRNGYRSITLDEQMRKTSAGTGSNYNSGSVTQRRPRTRTITTATSDEGQFNMNPNITMSPTHTIVIHNMLHLWPCRPDVAAEYEITRQLSPLIMSQHNLNVAKKFKLPLHIQVWKMLIEHINNEFDALRDPAYALTGSQLRFEWSGESVGLGAFLPQLADYLEHQGEIQLLVGISVVLSSLRANRELLKMETQKKLHRNKIHMPTMNSEMETCFVVNSGQVIMLEKPDEALGQPPSFSSAQFNPTHVHGASLGSNTPQKPPLTRRSTAQTIGGSMSESGYDRISPRNISESFGRNNSGRNGIQNDSNMSGASFEASQRSNTQNGTYFSLEITDDSLFEFSCSLSPSGVYARPKNEALQRFIEWTPRLLSHRVHYASLLHTWGLYMQRAEAMKPNYFDPLVAQTIFQINQPAKVYVNSDKAFCALCDQPVTKIFEFCAYCRHALHCSCAQNWWRNDDECPAACGCRCKEIS